jgi:methylated-DNA-[protein]-cysteine S-methyltransferase
MEGRLTMFAQYMKSPIGWLKVYGDARGIMEITFEAPQSKQQETIYSCMIDVLSQLEEYFAGTRKKFDIPLTFQGTSFQYDVYQALLNIPYGQTKTYQEIAEEIGNPKATQAVGNALHNNKFAVVVPCHRVIGQHKKVSNYLGGAEAHHYLLDFEASKR